MSLVLEALRRLEKPDSSPGSIGVAVASYRPKKSRERRSAFPLVLGLISGLALLELAVPRMRSADSAKTEATGASLEAVRAPTAVARVVKVPSIDSVRSVERAELQFRRAKETQAAAVPGSQTLNASQPRAERQSEKPPAALVLQAISQRDSHPIAIVNDQLVKEGDLIGASRVTRIGADAVEILTSAGKKEFIRFAAPPEPAPSPTPGRD